MGNPAHDNSKSGQQVETETQCNDLGLGNAQGNIPEGWFNQLPNDPCYEYQVGEIEAIPEDVPMKPTCPSSLWCDFAIFDGLGFGPNLACSARFDFSEKEAWIQHHLQHFDGNQLPDRLQCWFCDKEFSPRGGASKHYTEEEARAVLQENYRQRLEHIFNKVATGNVLCGEHYVKRDDWLLQHLEEVGMISAGDRRMICEEYDGVRGSFKLLVPTLSYDNRPPPELDRQELYEVHDQRKEDRERRRKGKRRAGA